MPCIDGDLAWPGTAEQSLLCWEWWLMAKIFCSEDSWGHFVAEGIANRPPSTPAESSVCPSGPSVVAIGITQPALPALPCSAGGSCLEIGKPSLQNPPGSSQIAKLWSHEETKKFLVTTFPTDFQNSDWVLGPMWLTDIHTIILFSFHHALNRI